MFYDKGYPVKTIGDVIDRKISRVAKVFDKTDEIQYLDISSIDNSSKTVTGLTPYVLKDAPSRAQYVLKQGDIMYSTVRPNLQNVAINPYSEGNVVGSTGFCVLRCLGVTTGYMWGVVNSVPFTEAMINQASGANYPAVTDKVVHAYEIPIPPKDAQDDYERLVKQSDKSKFTGFKSQFIEMFDNKGYPEKFGKDLFKFSSGKFLSEEKRLSEGVPVYGGNGIAWYTDEPLVTEDTIIIGRVGAYCGNVRLVRGDKWITDNAIYITQFKSNDFELEFLEKLMAIYDFHQYAGAAAQPKITQKPLEQQMYVVPPLDIQRQFADFVHQSDKSK